MNRITLPRRHESESRHMILHWQCLLDICKVVISNMTAELRL